MLEASIFSLFMKSLICLYLLLGFYKLYGQNLKAANNWCFGDKAGVTFNTTPPSSFTCSMTSLHHCATISNPKGELLFYTDGITVYGKDGHVMPNGTALKGDLPLPFGENVIILPYPHKPNLFFIFTISITGLYYTLVNMDLNMNNGDVVSSIKNQYIGSDVKNFMSSVGAVDGSIYWLLTERKFKKGLLAYRVDSCGFNADVVQNNVRSYYFLKFTPSGKRVAVDNGEKGIDVYNFDIRTGQLDNPLTFLPSNSLNIQSFSFSPNEQYLYVNINSEKIVQYDLLAGEALDIVNSEYIVHESSNIHQLQLAPNGVIYASIDNQPYLSAIEHPNKAKDSCRFNHDAVFLNGARTRFGLPTIVQSFVLPHNLEFTLSDHCLFTAILLEINTTSNVDLYSWHFGDGTTSTKTNPSHTYSVPGTYKVSLAVSYQDGSQDTVRREVTVYGQPLKPMIAHE